MSNNTNTSGEFKAGTGEHINLLIEQGIAEETARQEVVNKAVDENFASIQSAPQERSPELKKAAIGEIANDHAITLVAKLAKKTVGPSDLSRFRSDYLLAAKQADPQVDESEAIRQLQDTLASHHDANFGLGKTELASEIDALKRSLEKAKSITSADGQAFIARLEAGEFDSNPADADYAIKEYFDKPEDKWLKTGSGEADLLIAAKDARFEKLGVRKEKDGILGGSEDAEIDDTEIDDIFGGDHFNDKKVVIGEEKKDKAA